MSLILFSDLDGTLLDHETYSWEAAIPALNALKARGIPLVLASSKTAVEIAPLRAAMGFSHCPAIVENGAGVLAAGALVSGGDAEYRHIRAVLKALPDDSRMCFQGFGDLSAQGVADLTGLSLPNAALAKQRQFSEPGLFSGSDEERGLFLELLHAEGLRATQGGRFLTISCGATKADQIAPIQAAIDPAATTMALGDAPNDIAMLQACDIGVIIPNPAHAGLDLSGFERAPLEGPAGWNAAVLTHIDLMIH